ncbi:MAG: type III pantothenate kinase, partial [Coriobacteriales bacterium]
TALVVDMGTAITYDVVTADGKFLGGNIAPGIFVRLEALNHFTKALPLVETDGDCPRWGYDTTTALRAGAAYIYAIAADGVYKQIKVTVG